MYAAAAGPHPLPAQSLTASGLAEAIRAAQLPEIRTGAARLGQRLSAENGTVVGEESFYRHLPLGNMMYARQSTEDANNTGAKLIPHSLHDGGVKNFASECPMWQQQSSSSRSS